MKDKIYFLALFLAILASGCEKEGAESVNSIVINTGQDEYATSSEIDVTLTNGLDEQAAHFICDNSDLDPAMVLKMESGTWSGTELPIVCTQRGPMGYLGVLEAGEIRHDTISMHTEAGIFKLRYRFVIDSDTMEFDSNEFLIHE